MAAIVGGAAALGGLVATLKIGVTEFTQAQKVMAQTGAVLKSTGNGAKVTSGHITSMSTSLMKLSGIDDETIQSGENLLLTFTKIRNETGKGNKIFDQATLAMTNLSVAMGKDLNASAILVGKALNDPVKGVGALSRAGVQFTESQKETIKALVKSGDVMGAQKMILKELEVQFGGSAKAAGQTLTGQLNILRETFNNVAGDLVAVFIPFVSRAATALLNFVRGFANAPTLTAKIDFVIGKFRDLAWSGIQTVSDWWQKTKVTFEDNPGNRLKVTITDSGEDQLNTFFEGIKKSLDKKADTLGKSLGKKIVKAIFGGGKEQATESGDAFINDLLVSLLINKPAFDLGKRFVLAIFDGMREEFNRSLTDNPVSVFIKSLGLVLTPQFGAVGKAAADKLAEAVGTGRKKVVRAITDTVREAVNAARQGLAGLGSSLGGMLATITGTSSADAKRAAEIRAQQKAEATTRERARLTLVRDSAATDEELAQAKQDLADFELEIEASAAEDRVAIAQSANQRSIDALIESFNQGTISAKKFESDLNGIIGADRGGELGAAFAGAFGRELESIVAAANDIQSVINKSGKDKLPITGGMGTPAGDAARAAHDEWKAARAARLKTARDARRTKESDGGTKITPAEQKRIDEIMDAYDKKNPEPIRMAAGGILKRQVFTAGEAGREAVIPLGSSEAMNILRQAVGGGGGATYVLNIQAGLGTNPDELGRVIVESIKKFEKRNGQVFAGPQIQATSAGVSTNGGTQSRSLRMG